MINYNDLWVGDTLQVRSDGRIVFFHTIEGENVLCKYNSKIESFSKVELVRINLPDELEGLDLAHTTKSKSINFYEIPTQIDLHLDKLIETQPNFKPLNVLNYQLRKFEEYLQLIISNGLKKVTIIHGKGVGILKAEIDSKLNSLEEVKIFFTINEGGATEVHLY